jgi:diguanylate cyclase (GGDEF)-like protein
MPRTYYDFMLISSEQDREWDDWLRHALEQHNYSVFSGRNLPAGSNRVDQIDEAIRASDRVILILTPNFTEDPQTRAQWTAVLKRELPGASPIIIPVKVEDCTEDGLLGPRDVIDLSALDESASVAELIRAIRSPALSEQAPRFPRRVQAERASRLDRNHGDWLMMEFLDKQVPSALGQDRECSIMMLDVDDLTKINKRCGRAVGDSVISEVLAILTTVPDLDEIGRCGEDTFFGASASMGCDALLIVAFGIVDRIHDHPWSKLENDLRVTCSIGVTQFREDESSIDAVRRAVQGFRNAKETGGNRATLGPRHIRPTREGEVRKLDFS